MRRFFLVLPGLGLALAGFAGCGGDQSWTSDANWQGDDRSRTGARPESEAQTLIPAAKVAESDAQTWFGVRHDLSMSPSAPRAAACGCLAVEVGMPGKQAFTWDGEIPVIGPDAVVVAVSSKGVDCPAEPDEQKRRASISAVDHDGDDVLVEIEDLPPGRPLALGAIVPKPGPNGALYVVPRDKKVKWVPQGAASNRCKLKSPNMAPPLPPGAQTIP